LYYFCNKSTLCFYLQRPKTSYDEFENMKSDVVSIFSITSSFRHGDEMTGPATPKQWGEDETRPRCSEMRALIDDDHPE
jgi:hypothetical protein